MAKKEFISSDELAMYQKKHQQIKPLLLFSLVALIATICCWHLIFQNIELKHPWIILTVALLPLLAITPGVVLGSYRGAIWACFVSLFYFMAGVLNWTQVDAWLYGLIETLLSITTFILALLYARWKGFTELPLK